MDWRSIPPKALAFVIIAIIGSFGSYWIWFHPKSKINPVSITDELRKPEPKINLISITDEQWKPKPKINLVSVTDELLKNIDKSCAPFKIGVKGIAHNTQGKFVYLVVKDINSEWVQPGLGANVEAQFESWCNLGRIDDPGSLGKPYTIFAVVTEKRHAEFEQLERSSIKAESKHIKLIRSKISLNAAIDALVGGKIRKKFTVDDSLNSKLIVRFGSNERKFHLNNLSEGQFNRITNDIYRLKMSKQDINPGVTLWTTSRDNKDGTTRIEITASHASRSVQFSAIDVIN